MLEIQVCRGHCGYPVTHFWRHVANYGILFQVKISWNIDGHSLDGYQTLGVIPKEELGEILHAFMKWDFGGTLDSLECGIADANFLHRWRHTAQNMFG